MNIDAHKIEGALRRYYGTKLRGSEDIRISEVNQMVLGISHKMYSFHLEYVERTKRHSENLILRMGNDEEALSKEYRALEKLHSTSVPVPKVYDMGKDMLGSFFIIMEKVEGQTMGEEGVLAGMTESEKVEVWQQFAKILEDIHMLDWERAGFGFLNPPIGEYGFIDQALSPAREGEGPEFLESHGLTPVLDWLNEHKPPSDYYVLLHGDYHPNNVLVQNGDIVAVIDWEGVSIGDAAHDVAQLPLFLKTVNITNQLLCNMMDTFLEHYQTRTESELRNLDYYQILKATQFLVHFLLRTDIDNEWRSIVLETCAKHIEEMTHLKLPSSLIRNQ